MSLVAATETDPGINAVEFLQEFDQCLCLYEAGNGLTGKDVCTCFDQGFHAWTMEIHQLLFRQAVVAAILRSICEVCTIGSNGRGNKRFGPSNAVCFIRPKLISRFDSKLYRFLN